tara:strand:- start:3341 stop:4486 length:1146 start_codon:yes stop_codon:yes gene_type:complete
MPKKILIVVGTRPEVIKVAPIINELKKSQSDFNVRVCITGQHESMLISALEIFQIKPDYNLKIMEPNQTLFSITSKIINKLEAVLEEFGPDLVMVHGDTTTTLSASIASFYKKIKVAHIEAGLRTSNKYSPYPEEMNRRITSQIADYNFAPTKESFNNLLNEGIDKSKIIITGNTVIDALLQTLNKISDDTDLKRKLEAKLALEDFHLKENRRIVLVTGHRRENFGEKFINICKAIKDLAIANNDIDIVYPVHLNPMVQEPVYNILKDLDNVFLINPLDYESFIYLMNKSYIILTDSGGVQEEAPSIGKPVLVFRENTERPEAVDAGTVKIVGTERNKIRDEAQLLLDKEQLYNEMSRSLNPYGDGQASKRIIKFLTKEFL